MYMQSTPRRLLMRLGSIGGATLIAAAVLATSASAAAMCGGRRVSPFPCVQYQFETLNDNKDLTFNQLLGINPLGQIAGYFGSGGQGHPNKGYLLVPQGGGYSQSGFQDTNFPNSAQTQVTGLNNGGTLVGFWADQNDANFGWYKKPNGKFVNVNFPTQDNSSPAVNQLLGVNNSNTAVGFYNDGAGNSHGYWYDIGSGNFHPIRVPSDVTSDTAAGVNDHRDIAGFATTSDGTEEGFLIANGSFNPIMYPGASSTQALGVNNSDEVVGVYTMGTGDNAQMFGFSLTNRRSSGATNTTPVFQTISDPNGQGTTTVNGISSCGNIVGFYVDAAGNTDGMLGIAPDSAATARAATDATAISHGKKHKKHKRPRKPSGRC
jgi:hypothetical protein